MEVITKEKDKCEKFFIDWFKDIFNIEDEKEIKSIIIYSKNEQIYELNFKE